MPRKPINYDTMDKETVAFIPSGCSKPVIQDVPKAILMRWLKGILKDEDLIVRYSCLSNMYLLCVKSSENEPFNFFASELILFRDRETVGGNCFVVRVGEVKNGVPEIKGLTQNDVKLLDYATDKFFEKGEKVGIIL